MSSILEQLLKENGVRHFSASELLHANQWGITQELDTGTSPASIIQCAKLADAIRIAWGRPVRCLSAYRSLKYNRIVGSKDSSQHVKFRAMDLRPMMGDMNYFYMVSSAAVEGARSAGLSVGFGMYTWGVHIDVGGRVVSSTWDER
jgi:hypothetical protein